MAMQFQNLFNIYASFFKRFGPVIGIGASFFLFTVLITYPLITMFNTAVPGEGDVFVYMWTLWWFAYALVIRHQFPLFTDLMFYPTPLNIAQDVSIVHGLIALPVSLWFGPMAAYNYIIFVTFILTGIGFYLFFKLLTKHSLAAFFGTFIFTFSYYRIHRALIGHLDLASTEWYGFALYFLSLIFIYQKREWKNYVWAAVFMALSAYTEYRSFFYFSVFSGVFVISATAARMLVYRNQRTLGYIYEEVLSYASLLVPLFIFIVPLFAVNLTKTYDVQFAPTYPEFNAVIPAFIFPPCGVLLSAILPSCFASTVWEGRIVYLGIISVILAAIYIFIKKDKLEKFLGYLFGACFFVFIILSLGTKTPIYVWLFDHVFFFRILRVPSRFIIIAEISIAVFAALTLSRLFAETFRPHIKYAVTVVLLALLILEAVPTNMKIINVGNIPRDHLDAIEQGNNYAILEVPFGFRGNIYTTFGSHKNDLSFYYQMFHKTPLIGGYMSMIDEETWLFMYNNQLIRKLVLCQNMGECEPLDDKDRIYFTSVFRIRYVIFLDRTRELFEQHLAKNLNLQLLYRRGDTSVWENPSFKN